MLENRAQEYRRWAAECLSLASRAEREDDKKTWLELASKWQRLAQEIEPGERAEKEIDGAPVAK